MQVGSRITQLGKLSNSLASNSKQFSYKYCVVGAGPAGLCSLGAVYDKLNGQNPDFNGKNDISWIDQNFTGGPMAERWYNVPSNTKVNLFTAYFKNSKCFEYDDKTSAKELNRLDPLKACRLGVVGKEVAETTNLMMSKVSAQKGQVTKFVYDGNHWELTFNDDFQNSKTIKSEKVIFAPGADPVSFAKNNDIEIPLEQA